MLFPSQIFLFIFLPFTIFFYYTFFRKNRRLQNVLLTVMSLLFYAWGEPVFVFVMLGVIGYNYLFALLIDKHSLNISKAKAILVLSLICNILIFFIFKYLTFTLENINGVFNSQIPVPGIALPIGISFFIFQAMSYVIDVYRKNGEVQKNVLNVALYISFFPQLIAGPIVRYQTIADQINSRKESFDYFSSGVCRFIFGLSKKVLISNNVALVADAAFESESPSVVLALLGAVAYTFQIYFDFSGYSDMAIGLGNMFGFKFLENFDYPYVSKSITEFWRRWHISLGTWFRDYVYFPLGGSRVDSKSRLIFNLFVVWMLTGFWHGANWTFILWGFTYFILLSFEKLTGLHKKMNWLGHIYTMFFVILGWVLFRAEDISHAGAYISSMFGINGNPVIDDVTRLYINEYFVFFIFAAIFSLPVSKVVREKLGDKKISSVLYPIITCGLLLLSISYIVKGSYNPFIYFNF